MPGFEIIGREEQEELNTIFENANGVLFRMGFDGLRNGVYKVRQFETNFAQEMKIKYALACSSGSAALRLALAGLGIGPGDEVITQSFTFVATVEAIVESRAIPICTNIDQSLNMCPRDLERRITPRTKAIIVVHMLGVPVDMDAILAVAKRAGNLPVVEDTAWGCGAEYKGKKLGTIGQVGTYSFDHAKAMTTGEGGMVVTNDHVIDANARAFSDHGHENNSRVPRWEDSRRSSGFNYRMSELQGAVGLAQLRKLPVVIEHQRRSLSILKQALTDIPDIEFRPVPVGGQEAADAAVFYTPSPELARRCRQYLIEAGVGTKILPEAITWHFAGTWDHISELVQACGPNLSQTYALSQARLSRAVALPISIKMSDSVPDKARQAIKKALS